MLSQQEKQRIKSDLSQYDNIGDMFVYLERNYDLKQAKIGFLTKPLYIDGVIKALEMFKPPKK